MVIELPVDLTPELVPLSWLLGSWEGYGMLGEGEDGDQHIFQRATFVDTGLPVVEYRAETWISDADGTVVRPLSVESGFWQLDRELVDADGGPGLIPGDVVPALRNADAVEELRNEEGGFDLQVSINHPRGVSEQYYGVIKGPQVTLATDGVMRGKNSREYASATRIFGLVNNDLLWRWDVSTGDGLKAHASAALKKVEQRKGKHHGGDEDHGEEAHGEEDPNV
ncbi:MAG: FABP family protein [Galactobacter sp.]